MERIKFSGGIFFIFILVSVLLVAGAASAKDFSADMVMTSRGHKMQGKIFLSGQMARVEMPQAISISRPDRKVVYVLMPEQKMYMEQPIRPENIQSSEKMPGELERKYLGTETVEGVASKKYRVTYKYQDRTTTVYEWINADEFPVKFADEKGDWTVEYRNIKKGAQPSSLFEVPVGYSKMTMPSFGAPPKTNKDLPENEGTAEPEKAPEQQQQQNLPGGLKIPKLW